MEKPVVTGITHRVDEAKIRVRDLPSGVQAFNRVFAVLANEGIFVDMISQTGAENGNADLSFTVPEDVSARALALTEGVCREFESGAVSLHKDIAKVSIVGIGMRYHTGVAAKLFATLAEEGIDVQMISTSEIKVSVIISRKYCELAVRSLHEAFIDQKPVVSEER